MATRYSFWEFSAKEKNISIKKLHHIYWLTYIRYPWTKYEERHFFKEQNFLKTAWNRKIAAHEKMPVLIFRPRIPYSINKCIPYPKFHCFAKRFLWIWVSGLLIVFRITMLWSVRNIPKFNDSCDVMELLFSRKMADRWPKRPEFTVSRLSGIFRRLFMSRTQHI